MSDLHAEFEQAQKDVETLSTTPSDSNVLALYAHYKQAHNGDVSGKRPPFTDLKGRAKHDAWANLAGMSRAEAMRGYVQKVQTLLEADPER